MESTADLVRCPGRGVVDMLQGRRLARVRICPPAVGRFVEARVSQLANGARAGASLDIVPGGEVPEAVVVLGAGSIGMSAGGSIRQDAP